MLAASSVFRLIIVSPLANCFPAGDLTAAALVQPPDEPTARTLVATEAPAGAAPDAAALAAADVAAFVFDAASEASFEAAVALLEKVAGLPGMYATSRVEWTGCQPGPVYRRCQCSGV